MVNQHTIHETIVRDVFDLANDIKNSDEVERVRGFRNGTSIKSITSKSEGLVMVFPVICSRNMSYESAAMISKAIERKCVTMLQLLFSAANITDAEDGMDYISRFHTNLGGGRMSVDDFMHMMDDFVQENALLQENTQEYENYKKLQNDMKAMNFYFECDENLNNIPLDAYKVVNVGESGNMIVNTLEPVNEDWLDDHFSGRLHPAEIDAIKQHQEDEIKNKVNNVKHGMETKYRIKNNKALGYIANNANKNAIEALKKDNEEQRKNISLRDDLATNAARREEIDWKNRKAAEEINKLAADVMRNRLVDNDIKKVNELVPTLMYVNFISKGNQDDKYPIKTSVVVGVKAKLYAVDGQDIMNRLKIKHNDKNLLLNLIKVSTREISFFKDFLFAIDKAKIDALSQSRRGSSNKIWKVLERRADRSKIRRMLNLRNDATAITTLCITQDEVEFLRKTEYIDVEDSRVIRPIMDAYNLMGFVIADDAMEICKFMFDTEDRQYEILTYNNLEREQRDNTKKILNLMAKMR